MKNKITVYIIGIGSVLLIAFWSSCLIYGINKLPDQPITISELGSFGDFFGCFNALVSVLGFSAVVYSLHEQHKDSKNANEQFIVNSRIELFEKRFDVYQIFLFVIQRHGGIKLEESDEVKLAWLKSQFLFPEDPPLHQLLEKLNNVCFKISVLDDLNDKEIQSALGNGLNIGDLKKIDLKEMREQRAELGKWFKQQKEPLEQLIFKYLKIGSSV